MPDENQPNPDATASSDSAGVQLPPMVRGQKVIQPSPGLAEELRVQRQQEVTTQPQPALQPTQPTQMTQVQSVYGLGRSVDTSKIYPNMSQPSTTASPLPDDHQTDVEVSNGQRVAARVPSVMVYAFLTMIYSIYTLINIVSVLRPIRVVGPDGQYITTSGLDFNSPLLFFAFGVTAFTVAVGVYLLLAKSMKTVSALLTALLVIGGISLLNSFVNLAHYTNHISARSVILLFISIGLLMYLWSVKSQVDLASIE